MPSVLSAVRDVTVGALLSSVAATLPDEEALVYCRRRWTFRTLNDDARLIARGLLAVGVKPGDRVAVWATNVPEWIILQFALAKIGAILVTVNTALRAHEIEYLLRQSESSTLVTIGGFRSLNYIDELRSAGAIGSEDARRERLPHLERVVFIGSECPKGLIPFDDLRTAAGAVPDGDVDALERGVGLDDVINMQYTSGTTGFPKGVMLSSRNIVNNGYWLAEGLGLTPADRLCLSVPLFHCFGCVIGVLGAYTHGACLCPVESFDARRVLATIDRERCTTLFGVPTMFLAELEDPEFARFDLTSLRTGIMAGAPCPEPLMRRVIEVMHLAEMTIVYGLTEASPGITQTPRQASIEERTQTVGRALPEVEVRIVDPATERDVATGERGELWARGYVVMKGYYDMPEQTAAAVTHDGCAAATRRRWTLRAGFGSRVASRTSSSAAARTSRRKRWRTRCGSTRLCSMSRCTGSRATSSAKRSRRRSGRGSASRAIRRRSSHSARSGSRDSRCRATSASWTPFR
jgi:fatty-acyl-CoA synthase